MRLVCLIDVAYQLPCTWVTAASDDVGLRLLRSPLREQFNPLLVKTEQLGRKSRTLCYIRHKRPCSRLLTFALLYHNRIRSLSALPW